MQKLILIKHARPEIVPSEPPQRWRLSDEGRRSCAVLAQRIAGYEPQRMISSDEDKAVETAELVAADLKIPSEIAPDLHEHDRSNVPHMASRDFISHVELMLRRPRELVLGRETAEQAADRFERAVRACCAKHNDQTLAIVSHGTVIALLVARHNDCNAFELWRRMALPSLVVLSSEDFALDEVVERLD